MKKILKKINKKKSVLKKETKKIVKKGKPKVQRSYTLKEICNIMGIEVPERYKDIQDIPRNNITLRRLEIDEGCIYFGGYDFVDSVDFYDELVDKGAAVIFVDPETYDKFPPKETLPVIRLENYMEKQGKFFNYVKEQFKVPTIAITGSIGKTTTTQLVNCIFDQEYNIFKYSGNWNTVSSVVDHIMNKLSEENDMYIQECGAGMPYSIEKSAMILRPNLYILTNVLPHHIDQYKTVENVFKDKTSFSKYLKRRGALITNFDDDMIANHKFPHKVISVGINTDKKVDYRAINILQNKEYLELDVVHHNKTVHLKVRVVGKHNAYNILLAYAAAKYYKISDNVIQRGLLEFKTKGIRQNIRNIGGVYFYLDCYNVAFEAINADLKTLEDMPIDKGCKKIAFLAPENKLGENYKEKIYEFGKTIKNPKVDHIICYTRSADDYPNDEDYYGMNSKPLYQGIKDAGFKNVYDIDNYNDLVKIMKELCSPGDIVLIKANFELDITMAIDEIYGTSITMDNEITPSRYKEIEEKNYKFKVTDAFGKGSITEYTGKDVKTITIPDKIKGYPVFRIGKKVFRTLNLEKVDFGKSVENIGRAAFARCSNLKELYIPKNVKWISDNAFSLCKSLEKVVVEEGLINIGYHAFYNCTNLKEVTLPKSLMTIDEDAFDKVKNLTVKCYKDSAAYNYAKERNFTIKLMDN